MSLKFSFVLFLSIVALDLQCATANAAKLFGGDAGAHIGRIENGCFADLEILKSNPLDDIAHASDIATVIKNGVVLPAQSILR